MSELHKIITFQGEQTTREADLGAMTQSTESITGKTMEYFPSDADFNVTDEDVIAWRDVVRDTPLKIADVRNVNTKNGEAMIVRLIKRDGATINAWTTKLIKDDITKRLSDSNKKQLYITSRGLKASQKTNNSYYDFKIISM